MEITSAAKSVGGTAMSVGTKMEGSHQPPDCRQKVEPDKAKQLRR